MWHLIVTILFSRIRQFGNKFAKRWNKLLMYKTAPPTSDQLMYFQHFFEKMPFYGFEFRTSLYVCTYLFRKTKNSVFDLLGQLNSHFLIFCVENDSRRNFAIFAFWHDWRIRSNSARLWIFVSYVWSDCHLHILILNKCWHDQKYWPQNVKLCRCFQKWRLPFLRNVSIFPPFMFTNSQSFFVSLSMRLICMFQDKYRPNQKWPRKMSKLRTYML